MEVKKNLNNTQRKILDEVYTQQFDTIARQVQSTRASGLADVQTKVVKKLLKDKEIKKMLDAGATFFALSRKLESKLDGEGVHVDNRLNNEPSLVFGRRGWSSVVGTAPEIKEYQTETARIELALAEKKKEMRAKIWGTSVSYEEADAEIKALLKDL